MEWINVKDKLPTHGVFVLITLAKREYYFKYIRIAQRFENSWFNESGQNCIVGKVDVTHWMPLPEPPTENIK